MTWVQVECSNGTRYAAPSHGRPLPELTGMGHLFLGPLNLRRLQTFELLESVTRDIDAAPCHNDGARVTVVADQRDLGGQFGITTVVVGGEGQEEEANAKNDGVGDGHDTLNTAYADAHEQTLQRLLERVFVVLVNTNDCGVAVLLDALCTRSPLPLTTEAASRAATVVEDDGRTRDSAKESRTASNRRFLQRLTHGACASLNTDTSSPLQLLPSNSLFDALASQQQQCEGTSCFAQQPTKKAAAPSRPLSFASAVRRQSLLFFLEHDVVPLSMLASHVHLEKVVQHGKKHASASTAAGAAVGAVLPPPAYDDVPINGQVADAVTGAVSPDELLTRLVRHIDSASLEQSSVQPTQISASPATATETAEFRLNCRSPLQRQSSKALGKSATWAAVAQTAQESGHMLLLLFFRLFVHRRFTQADAAAMEHILWKEMWQADCLVQRSVQSVAPMVAAYSPSGLLMASTSYRTCFSHEEHMLLAAAAVDRLCRFASSLPPTSPDNEHARYADVLHWISWPMRVGSNPVAPTLTPATPIVDVLLLTVGDALALYVCFPRTLNSASARTSSTASPAVAAALSLQEMERFLERTVASADAGDIPSLQGGPSSSPLRLLRPATLADSLAYVCTHSTKPYTPAFHDALFVATAVEEALGIVHNGHPTSRGAAPYLGWTFASNSTANEMVVSQLRHLLDCRQLQPHEEQPRSSNQHHSSSAQTQLLQYQSTSGAAAAATTATATNSAAAPTMTTTTTTNAKSRSGLHKLFACLPLRKRSNGSGSAMSPSARKSYTAEAIQQSEAHIQHFTKVGTSSSSPHADPAPLPSSQSARTAGLLAMPLESMACCVAALVTRNEVGALRRMHDLGLHSFFFLQQGVLPHPLPGVTNMKGGQAHGSWRTMLSSKVGAGTKQRMPTTSACAGTVPRFGLSFSRLCLQQPQCPSALLPVEWIDVEGAQDGSGGRLTFIEDPTLTLHACCGAPSPPAKACPSHSQRKPMRPAAAVLVLPCWSVLHVAPAESHSLEREEADGTLANDEVDSLNASMSSASTADNTAGMVSCPASMREEAQLLTSLSFKLSQKLNCGRSGGVLQDCCVNMSSSPAAGPATFAAQLSTSSEAAQTHAADPVWVNVAAIVNICGGLTGEKADALLHALQRHGASRADKAVVEGKGRHAGDHGTAGFEDSDPVEFEHAAGVSAKLKELCHELLLCQEAALLLLEDAACRV